MAAPQIPTIENLVVKDGRIPYDLVRAIRNLQQAIGQSGTGGVVDPALVAQLAALQREVAFLRRQFDVQTAERVIGEGGGTGGGGGLGTIGAGSAPPTIPFPTELAAVVNAYAADHPAELANSCVTQGGSWDYTDGLIAALKAVNERVSYNGTRGDVSDIRVDAAAIYHGILPPVSGSNDVYVVDIISCSCPEPTDQCSPVNGGPGPGPSWNNVTTPRAAGAWVPSR